MYKQSKLYFMRNLIIWVEKWISSSQLVPVLFHVCHVLILIIERLVCEQATIVKSLGLQINEAFARVTKH